MIPCLEILLNYIWKTLFPVPHRYWGLRIGLIWQGVWGQLNIDPQQELPQLPDSIQSRAKPHFLKPSLKHVTQAQILQVFSNTLLLRWPTIHCGVFSQFVHLEEGSCWSLADSLILNSHTASWCDRHPANAQIQEFMDLCSNSMSRCYQCSLYRWENLGLGTLVSN